MVSCPRGFWCVASAMVRKSLAFLVGLEVKRMKDGKRAVLWQAFKNLRGGVERHRRMKAGRQWVRHQLGKVANG